MAGERTPGVTDSNFPHMPPRKAVVFNYYTLVRNPVWVAWGTGTPKDRDEVNRREVCECHG
jgi:hypothetical protein